MGSLGGRLRERRHLTLEDDPHEGGVVDALEKARVDLVPARVEPSGYGV